jgi:hypothetical protein
MEQEMDGSSRVTQTIEDAEAREAIEKINRRVIELGDQISRIATDYLVVPRKDGSRVSSETPGGHWTPFYKDIKNQSTRDILISYQLARELEQYWMDSFLGTALQIFLFKARKELEARSTVSPEQITAGAEENSAFQDTP